MKHGTTSFTWEEAQAAGITEQMMQRYGEVQPWPASKEEALAKGMPEDWWQDGEKARTWFASREQR